MSRENSENFNDPEFPNYTELDADLYKPLYDQKDLFVSDIQKIPMSPEAEEEERLWHEGLGTKESHSNLKRALTIGGIAAGVVVTAISIYARRHQKGFLGWNNQD